MAEEIRKRSEIEEKYKWDLTHIYASDEEWEKDYQAAETEIGTLSAFDGHVAENPKKAIITVNETVEKIMPIYEYAFLRKAGSEVLLVVANFDDLPATMDVTLPAHAFDYLKLKERKSVTAVDLLSGKEIKRTLTRDCYVSVDIEPLGAVILKFKA